MNCVFAFAYLGIGIFVGRKLNEYLVAGDYFESEKLNVNNEKFKNEIALY